MFTWFKKMLSNSEDASSGRFISLVCVICILNWISVIIARGAAIIPDIPTGVLTLALLPFLGSKSIAAGPDILGRLGALLRGKNADPGA